MKTRKFHVWPLPVGTKLGASTRPLGGPAVAGVILGEKERINTAEEEFFWRENHAVQGFGAGRPFEEFAAAYRVGYEGAAAGGTFEDREDDLRRAYEASSGRLSWDVALPAVRAAWAHATRRKDLR